MQVSLVTGAYEARSVIATAQRCINLYMEKNPDDVPYPYTHYPTPGLTSLSTAPVVAEVRGLYTASNGHLYGVVANTLYDISSSWVFTPIGTISSSSGQVSMKDNTLVMILVDGSPNGWAVDLATNNFGAITSTAFYGSTHVDYVDTFFVFNRPGTNQFYISLSNVTFADLIGSSAFDPLFIAGKTGGNDLLVAAFVMHREVSLVGVGTSEVWYDAGASDFPFQAMPGAFIEHGCQAKYSIAKYDLSLFWLGQDSAGNSFVLEESAYRVRMISTRAIANEINGYAVKSDAIGFTYIQQGHAFYVLTFPTQNVTWVWDIVEQHWHQRQWTDADGNAFRWRANCVAVFNNKVVVGDYQNGQIYSLDLDNYEDAGAPIVRIRSFPYLQNQGKRLIHRNVLVWMEVGTPLMPGTTDAAEMTLRISNDYGVSFPVSVTQSMGNVGQYLTSVQFNRLGLGRSRVYEVSWSAPMKSALSGVFLDVVEEAS